MAKRQASEMYNPMARDIDELKRKYPGRGETRHCYDLESDTRVFSNQKEAPNNTRKIKGLLTGREIVIPDTKTGYYVGRGDALSSVRKFGVIAPSTNTVVEYDFWRMLMKNSVDGVGLHQGHILIRMAKWSTDEELMEFLCQLRVEIDHAIDRCMTAEPEYLVMGMSAETFYGGWEGNIEFRDHIEKRTNLRVATGAEACKYALLKFGAKRIACVTPYMPSMDKQVANFFNEIGFECKRVYGFKCIGAVEIAHVTEDMCEAALREVDGDDVDAIVQCGTNLSFIGVADRMEVSEPPNPNRSPSPSPSPSPSVSRAKWRLLKETTSDCASLCACRACLASPSSQSTLQHSGSRCARTALRPRCRDALGFAASFDAF